MVPVASTTSWISPRSTFAVKCCTCVSRFSPNATNNPATATMAAKMSHLRFVIYVWSRKITNLSLVSQRFDRIKSRRLARGVISEKYPDSDREHRGHHDRLDGHFDGPTQSLSNQIRTKDSEDHTGSAPDEAQHDRFSQELKLDGRFGCPHRHSYSNLAGTFGYGNQHDVHDPNSSHEQRNRCDRDQENGESLARVELRLNDVLRIPDIKVVLFLRTQVVSIPEYSSCFLSGHLDRVG